MANSKLWSGLLLGSCCLVGCGNESNNIKPVQNPGAGGATGSGGGAGTAGSAAGASGSLATAGTGGGVAPVDGQCLPGSLKHPDGLCYCQPASLTLCADGCFDLQTDGDHCGNCDTRCEPTQACNAGTCGATPVVLVPAASGCGSLHLALADGSLFWTDELHGTVQSVSTAGGAPVSLASAENAPTLIAANGTSVYWLATGDKTIMKASTAGNDAQALISSASEIHGFTLSADGNTLYFSTETLINSISTTPGGDLTEVGHEDTGIPQALAVEGDLVVYPADINGDVDVMIMSDNPAVCASEDSMTATNENCARIGRSQGELNFESIFLVDGEAYWVNQTNVLTSSAVTPTGSNNTVASTDGDAEKLLAFSVGNGFVFFADDLGLVYQAPLMIDAEVTQLARAQMGITSIVADTAAVYFATSDCAIMSLPLD